MKHLKIVLNNIKALKYYKAGKTYLPYPPSFIWIEPTNHCNLRCIMCPNGAGKIDIKKGYMSFDHFMDIIEQIKDFVSTIVIALHGESTLHPQLIPMICYAKQRNIKVYLNTNGTLFTDKMSEQILDSGIDFISFAFDGFTKSSYEKARRGAEFEKTRDNIINFLKLRKKKRLSFKSNSPYVILSILMLDIEEYSLQEKKSFLTHFEGLIDEVRLREVSSWGSTFKDAKNFSIRNNNNYFHPCSRLWNSMCIAWDGTCLPCIYNSNHQYPIGNLGEHSLIEIWNSDKMVALRKSMLNQSHLKLSPLCDNCIITGTPPILGIPPGLRITIADAVINFTGYWFEREALRLANFIRNGRFSSKRIL